MTSSPELSVVTITYNDAAELRRTTDSLRPLFAEWPRSRWEHVIVDGSPALNLHVLRELPTDWPLVHLQRPPRGVADAFNQALAVARGTYIWFLNGGDALHEPAALGRLLQALDGNPAVDFVCGGAYLCRGGLALYPVSPRRAMLANLVGRSWMYHQAVVYRSASLGRVGIFSTRYRTASDYDYHLRCWVAGLRGSFTDDVVVNYDMGGGSNDLATVFHELKTIQRSHRADLPVWVNCANEIVRRVEYTRIFAFRTLAATRLGARLRRSWTRLNRWLRRGPRAHRATISR